MRVLLALDGSEPSDVARALVGNLAWPPETTIRLITITPELFTMFGGGPWLEVPPPTAPAIEEQVVEQQRTMLATASAPLERPGLTVEAFVRRGRPATTIVLEAGEFDADLVVVGARGHGAWETALLGSVSAEVVDHARCPVLVARTGTFERIVLAEDGSEGAAGARRAIATWASFASVPVRIVGVASVMAPLQSGVSPMLMDEAFEVYEQTLDEAKARLSEVADTAAGELAAAGREVTTEVRVGDPAREIVAAATEAKASLIAMGSRGVTGLRRLLLGSVARNVLHNAPCSVLIVRAEVAEQLGDEQPAAAAR
jgi:nucleotide-binding universal stress UspA family protein